MELVVISPQGVLLTVSADCVTLPGSMGAFSVLKNHAPLVSTLEKGEIVYTSDNKEKRYPVEGGISVVEKNRIQVLIE